MLIWMHFIELLEMRTEFILNFIQCIEGEKDPRNLLLVFSLHEVVSKQFYHGPLTEDLFDVVSCYFPIVFTAVRFTFTFNYFFDFEISAAE